MSKLLACASAALMFLLVAGALPAQNVGVVSNVKVISDKVEDVTTLEDWKKSYIKDGMSDADKLVAIWKTAIRYRHQDAPPNEYIANEQNVHDPMKTIHVYGYGQCCCASSNIEALARYLGFQARGRAIIQHSVPEVFAGGAWHLLDASVMNYYTREDGSIASVDDLRDAVRGWLKDHPDLSKQLRGNETALRAFAKDDGWKKNGPPLLATCPFYDKNGINGAGWHGWWCTMCEYDLPQEKAILYEYGPSMGYQVNVQLREGERLTRNWSNKGLHINMPAKAPGIMTDKQWAGVGNLQKKFGDVAPGRVGNGTLEWDVPMTKLAVVALSSENLAPGTARVLDPAKPGVLILRMPTSYIYLAGKLDLKAALGAGGSVDVALSDNNGLDWKDVTKVDKAGDASADLTPLVFRRYDYRLKFTLNGVGTALSAIKMTHDVQHSQAPLPAVLDGANAITFAAGPAEGTITYEGALNAKAAGKQVLMNDFHPAIEGIDPEMLRLGANSGSVTYTLVTPGDMTRVRFNSHFRARAARDGWTVEVSFDDGKAWTKLAELNGPITASQQYVVYDKVPAGVRKALLRFSGRQQNTTCMFDLRIDADYKEPFGGFRPVKITYAWTENGKDMTNVHVAQQPKDKWTITCGKGTVPKSYTVELAK